MRARRKVQDTSALVPPMAIMVALVGFLAAGSARAFEPLWLPALTVAVGAMFVGWVGAQAQASLTLSGAYGCGFWLLWIVGRGAETGYGATPELGHALVVIFGLMAIMLVVAALSRLNSGNDAVKRAISAAMLFLVFAWLVAMFSGDAGGADPLIRLLQDRLGLAQGTAETVTLVIRKGIHVVFYGLFAAVALRAARAAGFEVQRALWTSIGVVLAHAVFDETRQSFSPGRSGQWQDVVIDAVGVAIAVVAFLSRHLSKKS